MQKRGVWYGEDFNPIADALKINNPGYWRICNKNIEAGNNLRNLNLNKKALDDPMLFLFLKIRKNNKIKNPSFP